MIKHIEIRQRVIETLKPHVGNIEIYDGRPINLDESELPAVAVYLTDAQPVPAYLDADQWQCSLHIEVFLKAKNPDSALDKWMEARIYPALKSVPLLTDIIETMTPQGYDYQRDDEMALWASADLTYLIQY